MKPERLFLLLAGVLAQQAPLVPQAPLTPAANATTTVQSVVVVVTTQTTVATVRVPMPREPLRPSPIVPVPVMPFGPPEIPPMPQPQQQPEQQLPCPLDPLLRRMLVSGNYSSAFRIANPSGADDDKSIEAVCEANAFCAQRPPGLYCYRPPSRCQPSTNSTMSTSMSRVSGSGLAKSPYQQQQQQGQMMDDCLPVAMIMCPEAIFIGCSEGYACHQVPDVWPWDIPPSQRKSLFGFGSGHYQQDQAPAVLIPGISGSGYFQAQPNMTLPGMNNTTQPSANMTQAQPGMQPSSTFSAIAHCMAVIRDELAATKIAEAALMPSSSQDWNQWCAYRAQLKSPSNIQVTVGSDCATRTLSGVKIQASATGTTCPATSTESISTVWWWPGMETGAPPAIAKTQSSSASVSVDPCIPSPPPTCNGPYPYAPVPTSTYLFISVSTTSVPYTATLTQQSVSTVTASASTVTSSVFTTAFQTVTSTQTVTATPAPIATPEPVLVPQPAPAKAPETPAAQPAPAAQVPAKAPSAPAAQGPIPQELFPRAGEPYEVYTAKIGAIATIL